MFITFSLPVKENSYVNLTLPNSCPVNHVSFEILFATCALLPTSRWAKQPSTRAQARPPEEQRLTVSKPVKNSQWVPWEQIQAADEEMDFVFHAHCTV